MRPKAEVAKEEKQKIQQEGEAACSTPEAGGGGGVAIKEGTPSRGGGSVKKPRKPRIAANFGAPPQ